MKKIQTFDGFSQIPEAAIASFYAQSNKRSHWSAYR
jgi:hypothetical protein